MKNQCSISKSHLIGKLLCIYYAFTVRPLRVSIPNQHEVLVRKKLLQRGLGPPKLNLELIKEFDKTLETKKNITKHDQCFKMHTRNH